MNEETYHIDDLIQEAKDDLKEAVEFASDERLDYFSDIVHEVADQCVPIYYHDIFRYASDNSEVSHHEPELTTGNEEPYKVIQICIYEILCNALHESLQEIYDEVQTEIEEQNPSCEFCGDNTQELDETNHCPDCQ